VASNGVARISPTIPVSYKRKTPHLIKSEASGFWLKETIKHYHTIAQKARA